MLSCFFEEFLVVENVGTAWTCCLNNAFALVNVHSLIVCPNDFRRTYGYKRIILVERVLELFVFWCTENQICGWKTEFFERTATVPKLNNLCFGAERHCRHCVWRLVHKHIFCRCNILDRIKATLSEIGSDCAVCKQKMCVDIVVIVVCKFVKHNLHAVCNLRMSNLNKHNFLFVNRSFCRLPVCLWNFFVHQLVHKTAIAFVVHIWLEISCEILKMSQNVSFERKYRWCIFCLKCLQCRVGFWTKCHISILQIK